MPAVDKRLVALGSKVVVVVMITLAMPSWLSFVHGVQCVVAGHGDDRAGNFHGVAAVCRWVGVISSSRAVYMEHCCKLPNTTVRLLMWFPYEHFNTCGVVPISWISM